MRTKNLSLLVLLMLFSFSPCTVYGAETAFAPLSIGPDHTPYYYECEIRALFKADHWSEGKKLLDEALESYNTDSGICEMAGWYWLHMKKYDKARYHLKRALRDDHTNVRARDLLIKTEEQCNNWSSCISYINEQLELKPYDRTLWLKKIEFYRLQGNKREAALLAQRLNRIYTNDPKVKEVYNEYLPTLRSMDKTFNIYSKMDSLQDVRSERIMAKVQSVGQGVTKVGIGVEKVTAKVEHVGDAIDSLSRDHERMVEKIENVGSAIDSLSRDNEIIISKEETILLYEALHDSLLFAHDRMLRAIYNKHFPMDTTKYRNQLFFEYQQARRASVDNINGNATMEYTHIGDKFTYVGYMNYAGRDTDEDEKIRGGVGIQVGAALEYKLGRLTSIRGEVAAAKRFFPTFLAKAQIEREFAADWTAAIQASYRRIEGQDLFIAGLRATKMLEHFTLDGGLDGYLLMQNNKPHFYANAQGRMKFYPIEGNKGHIFAVGSVGNAPSTILIDYALTSSFKKMSTSVSLGGAYPLTNNLTIGICGAWYTYFIKSYRNYYYTTAHATIHF